MSAQDCCNHNCRQGRDCPQRVKLLKTLIDVRHSLQFANDSPGGGISDTLWMMHQPETIFDHLDTAIAEATGTTP